MHYILRWHQRVWARIRPRIMLKVGFNHRRGGGGGDSFQKVDFPLDLVTSPT